MPAYPAYAELGMGHNSLSSRMGKHSSRIGKHSTMINTSQPMVPSSEEPPPGVLLQGAVFPVGIHEPGIPRRSLCDATLTSAGVC